MSKKNKKHQPEAEEAERKPFNFLDSVQWTWKAYSLQDREGNQIPIGGEWIDPALDNWFFHLRNRVYKFHHALYDEIGLLHSWCTIDHAEQMIFQCSKHPVFPIDPSPMFLQRWLDTWIETMYCRLCNHVFDTLRLKKGFEEIDAAYRADVIGSEFEKLFDPTFPRVPKAPKPRRGSKRDRQMNEPTTHAKDPVVTAPAEKMPEDHIELRGPDPSPYTAFKFCYRVLDRRDVEVKLHSIPGQEGRLYEGVKVAALILGNDENASQIAADAAFREIRRRVVYDRLHVAQEQPVVGDATPENADAVPDNP